MSLVNFIWRLVLDSENQTTLENILHNLLLIRKRKNRVGMIKLIMKSSIKPKKIVVTTMFHILLALNTKGSKWYIICSLIKNCYVIHKLFLFTRNWHTRNKISEDFQDIYIMKNTLFYINGLKVFTCTSLEITLSKHFDQLNFLELHSCINLWHPINATSHIRNFTV